MYETPESDIKSVLIDDLVVKGQKTPIYQNSSSTSEKNSDFPSAEDVEEGTGM